MNLKCKMILEDYKKQRGDFVSLADTAQSMLYAIVKELGITVMAIEHRVKTEESLAGKLERKGDRYNSLEDITDILGCRVICFLSDEIDNIGKKVEERFVIDWENSSDKRALIKEDTFGYLSLHYICSLPFGSIWPDSICGKKFEIQIRTVLQHAWSSINHDIGYKSEFDVPRDIKRHFARLAGLLELADEEFVRTKNSMKSYTQEIRERIKADNAAHVSINSLSLNEYVTYSPKMKALIEEIASISGAEVQKINPESYVRQLEFLGITKLDQIDTMILENKELALKLAENTFASADLDIVSSSVALRFLCRAELLNKNYTLEKIAEFLEISLISKEKAQRQAAYLLNSSKKH